MLVSSAIADHGAKVTNYLMLDAAVASEAYDGAETKIQDMWRSEWGDFYNAWNGAADEDKPKYYRLIAAGWHSLFDNSDARARLTWKDRFESNPNNVNFYNGIFPAWWNYTFEQAFALSDDELKAKPFFNASGPHTAIYDSNQATASAHAGNYLNRAEILARMIPALTPATGKTSIKMFNPPGGQSKNIDMQASFQTGWPREREDNPIPRLQRAWYHSDLIDIAYIYINRLYSNFVEIGKLNKEL